MSWNPSKKGKKNTHKRAHSLPENTHQRVPADRDPAPNISATRKQLLENAKQVYFELLDFYRVYPLNHFYLSKDTTIPQEMREFVSRIQLQYTFDDCKSRAEEYAEPSDSEFGVFADFDSVGEAATYTLENLMCDLDFGPDTNASNETSPNYVLDPNTGQSFVGGHPDWTIPSYLWTNAAAVAYFRQLGAPDGRVLVQDTERSNFMTVYFSDQQRQVTFAAKSHPFWEYVYPTVSIQTVPELPTCTSPAMYDPELMKWLLSFLDPNKHTAMYTVLRTDVPWVRVNSFEMSKSDGRISADKPMKNMLSLAIGIVNKIFHGSGFGKYSLRAVLRPRQSSLGPFHGIDLPVHTVFYERVYEKDGEQKIEQVPILQISLYPASLGIIKAVVSKTRMESEVEEHIWNLRNCTNRLNEKFGINMANMSRESTIDFHNLGYAIDEALRGESDLIGLCDGTGLALLQLKETPGFKSWVSSRAYRYRSSIIDELQEGAENKEEYNKLKALNPAAFCVAGQKNQLPKIPISEATTILFDVHTDGVMRLANVLMNRVASTSFEFKNTAVDVSQSFSETQAILYKFTPTLVQTRLQPYKTLLFDGLENFSNVAVGLAERAFKHNDKFQPMSWNDFETHEILQSPFQGHHRVQNRSRVFVVSGNGFQNCVIKVVSCTELGLYQFINEGLVYEKLDEQGCDLTPKLHSFGVLRLFSKQDNRAATHGDQQQDASMLYFLMDRVYGEHPGWELLGNKGLVDAQVRLVAEYGVLHDDLQPSNMFLVPQEDGNTRVMFIDFANARIFAKGDRAIDEAVHKLTTEEIPHLKL